jgi:hypothetical protein
MKNATSAVLLVAALCFSAGPAYPVAQQIGAGDTALIFGGLDAEGGIGDWYVGNGVVEAIIDNIGPQPDLVGVVPTPPPLQSEINTTGGTIIDASAAGANGDQLTQMFTVGGLSTSNFLLYDTISAPTSDTIRVSGKIIFAPFSVQPSLCLDVVTDYSAFGTDPFITITSTATNNCGVAVTGFGGFLDVFIWTQRSLLPFSGGGPLAAKGFNHPVLNLSNPVPSLELPMFLAAPGQLRPADGIVDTANATTCGEVSYGVVGEVAEVDPDGPGGAPPSSTTPVNNLFGISSTLVTALGNSPGTPPPPGGTLSYTRRLYVGTSNDVRGVGDGIIAEMAGRIPFSTGTISGDVDAADTANVEASLLITRIGHCQANTSLSCKVTADCAGSGPCVDPTPTGGMVINSPLSHVRTDAAGLFSGVVLPQGHYELTVSSAERDDVVVRPVVVGAGNTPVAIPSLTGRGTVQFVVKEKTGGLPAMPAKLTFVGVSPTPDPRFNRYITALSGTSDIQAETFGGTQAGTSGHAAGQGNVVYTATGTGDIQVRPGTYDIYFSRGLEYSVAKKRVTVASGGVAAVEARLKRVIKTPNAISADFHVHSGRSLDTAAALRDRVSAFAAEGVEVMVSTDHDKNVDYSSFISSFGLTSRMTSIIGNEVTGSVPSPPDFPNSFGHINAWPLVLSPNDPRDGAIQDEYVAPNWIYKRLRDAGAEVIQYNHVRAGVSGITTIGFFNNIGCNRCANDIDMTCNVDGDCPAVPAPQDCTCVGYQPDRPITMAPNDILLDDGILGPGTTANTDGITNLDWDVMELANGGKDGDFPGWRQVRRDWLSLLNQGIYKPATGVSDSHRITVEHAGWARSFVLGVGDDPATLNVTNFNNQIKAGAMMVSSGPFIDFTVRPQGGSDIAIGQLGSATSSSVRLRIKVRSPAWMPVEEVRVIANGFVVASFDETTKPKVRGVPNDFTKTGRVNRFRANVNLTAATDTYYVVEAGPKLPPSISTLPTPPPIVDIVEPDIVPLAFTNPIFVDRNGNSVFDPPGLPVMMASAAPESPTLWERVRDVLASIGSRLRAEVVAQDKVPGEMTGVTKEQKREAMEKGEYAPIWELKIPPDAAEQLLEQQRKAAEAEAAGGK